MKPKVGATYYFAVSGSGDFPFDMLRYDACWPSSSLDASSIGQPCYSERKGHRVVILACRPGGYGVVPTVARWASFGWKAGNLHDNSFHAEKEALS